MTAQTGLFVQNMPEPDGSGATAKGSRLALAGLLAKNADGSVKVGVLADGLGPVVTGTSGMTYSIRKHVAVSKLSEAHGPSLVPNDGAVLVSTDPAPGSNSRIDIIWAQQRHLVEDGGSDTVNTPLYGVAKGSPSATPAAPSIPTGALELARVPVPAGTTATSALTFTQGPTTTANAGSWVDYSPTPAGVFSTASGRFVRSGRTVTGRATINVTGVGVDVISLSTPSSMAAVGVPVGTGFALRGSARVPFVAIAYSPTVMRFYAMANGVEFDAASTPGPWADGNKIHVAFTYEEA